MAKYHFVYDEAKIGRPEDFNYAECSKNCTCDFDLLDLLICAYNGKVRDNWEHCLDRKWCIADCITGCHNGDKLLRPIRRNSHQYCISNKALHIMLERIESSIYDKAFTSFDSLYDFISELKCSKDNKANAKGFGLVSIYDTALRLGWHHSPRLEPVSDVYLHQGALWGAKALRNYCKIKGLDWLVTDITNKIYKVPVTSFCQRLQDLGANHLENFLCSFHEILEGIALKAKVDKERELKKAKSVRKRRKIRK